MRGDFPPKSPESTGWDWWPAAMCPARATRSEGVTFWYLQSSYVSPSKQSPAIFLKLPFLLHIISALHCRTFGKSILIENANCHHAVLSPGGKSLLNVGLIISILFHSQSLHH